MLAEVERILNERQKDYGDPIDSFSLIASFWSSYLGKEVSPMNVAMMMVLLKIARNQTGGFKRDNLLDICGYAALQSELVKDNVL